MSSEQDSLRAYSEACNTIRHYSNASLAVRLASVVQGIAILVGWSIALTQKSHLAVALLPVVGLLFTVLLYRFHMGYFRATEYFYDIAASMEDKFFDEGCRPFSGYNSKHDEMYNNLTGKFLTLNAPFTLVGTMFVLAGLLSAINFFVAT